MLSTALTAALTLLPPTLRAEEPATAPAATVPTEASARPSLSSAAMAQEAEAARKAVVTLDVTFQDWAWEAPWRKRPPGTRSGSGVVLPDGRVLTCAAMVAGATLVELQRGADSTPFRAEVTLVDPSAGLAIVTPTEPRFGQGLSALPFVDALPAGTEAAPVAVHRYRASRRLDSFSGTVADIDVSEPGVGSVQLLTASVSAQLEAGGNCEPVTRQGRLLGLAYGKWSDRLSVLPAPTIRTWLEDAARGNGRRGFAAAGWRVQPLTNPVLRDHLGVPAGREGVLLTRVWPFATGAGVLHDGDVLLSLAGAEIDARGFVNHPRHGPLRMGALLTEGRLAGDTVTAEVVRAGRLLSLSLTLAPDAPDARRIPVAANARPRYVLHGGLLFQELTQPLLRAFGDHPPLRLIVQSELDAGGAGGDRPRYVVLSQVLPDGSTVGYEGVRQRLVDTVNDRPVRSLEELVAVLDGPPSDYVVVTFLDQPERLVLSSRAIAESRERITKAYQVPAARHL